MGVIYLVRHAQASFGTADYDRLTPIGFTQAELLGAYFARRKIRFDAVYARFGKAFGDADLVILGEDDASLLLAVAQCHVVKLDVLREFEAAVHRR